MSTTTIVPTMTIRAQRPAQVRLTRRGRAVVFVAAFLAVLAFGIWLAAGSVATQEGGEQQVEVITVGTKDTLWGIATAVAADTGEENIGDVVERIRDMNALDSSLVYAGQELRIPTE